MYIGSFWEHPLKHSQNRFLLEKEKADLLGELDGLPHNAVVRRINELVKRARSVKVHAYLIHYLRKQVPTVFGKSEKQAKLLQTLPREFVACARRYGLPLGDFPDINKFRARLGEVKDLRYVGREGGREGGRERGREGVSDGMTCPLGIFRVLTSFGHGWGR